MCILHTKKMIDSKKNYRRRGVALVELSLVLSILLALSLGLIQYGIIMNTAVTLTNLSREGVRFAVINPASDDAIKTYMYDTCPPGGLRQNWNQQIRDNIVITANGTRQSGSKARMTVTINYNMANRLFLPSQLRLPFMRPVRIFNTAYTTSSSMLIE